MWKWQSSPKDPARGLWIVRRCRGRQALDIAHHNMTIDVFVTREECRRAATRSGGRRARMMAIVDSGPWTVISAVCDGESGSVWRRAMRKVAWLLRRLSGDLSAKQRTFSSSERRLLQKRPARPFPLPRNTQRRRLNVGGIDSSVVSRRNTRER